VLDEGIRSAMLDVPRDSEPGGLTPTEFWTLAMLAEGYTSAAIAERAGLAVPTINGRITEIFQKLGIEDSDGTNKRVSAIVHYVRNLEKYRRIREIPPIDWPPPGSAAPPPGSAAPPPAP
jgi:DNA-binding NarL/FixJ family response regulator